VTVPADQKGGVQSPHLREHGARLQPEEERVVRDGGLARAAAAVAVTTVARRMSRRGGKRRATQPQVDPPPHRGVERTHPVRTSRRSRRRRGPRGFDFRFRVVFGVEATKAVEAQHWQHW
jgi:hypothetical protein